MVSRSLILSFLAFIISVSVGCQVRRTQTEGSRAFVANIQGLENCRKHVGDLICPKDSKSFETCDQKQWASHRDQVLQVFDVFPAFLQKAFCEVDALEIQSVESMAKTLIETDKSGEALWVTIQVSPLVFESNRPLSAVLTVIEQARFLELPVSESFQARNDLPRVEVIQDEKIPVDLDLFFFLAHELAHVVDALYQISGKFASSDSTSASKAVDSQWNLLSWKSNTELKTQFAFEQRKDLLDTERAFNVSDMDEIYMQLKDSPFVSLYAMKDPAEDFAETVAFYSLSTLAKTSLVLRLPSGLEIDMLKRIQDEQFLPKREFLESLSGL